MDHHLKCVARVLKWISAKGYDLRTERVMLSWLQEAILEEGFVPRIEKRPQPSNSAGLRALFYRRTDELIPETAVIVYDIVLDRPENEPERRFVIAKELSHIFDEDAERTATPEEIDRLVYDLISSPVRTDAPARADYNARMLAIEMLVPFERRQLVLAQGVTSAITFDLAVQCLIPLNWAQVALSPGYNAYIADLRRKARISDLY